MDKHDVINVSLEQLQANRWREIRQHRNKLLSLSDVEINKRLDEGENVEQWRAYRKQLRDLPQTANDPHQLVWPTKPAN